MSAHVQMMMLPRIELLPFFVSVDVADRKSKAPFLGPVTGMMSN